MEDPASTRRKAGPTQEPALKRVMRLVTNYRTILRARRPPATSRAPAPSASTLLGAAGPPVLGSELAEAVVVAEDVAVALDVAVEVALDVAEEVALEVAEEVALDVAEEVGLAVALTVVLTPNWLKQLATWLTETFCSWAIDWITFFERSALFWAY